MGKSEPGTRVYAVREANDDVVYAYGFGTYVGDLPLPGTEDGPSGDDAILIADAIRKSDQDREPGEFGIAMVEMAANIGAIKPEDVEGRKRAEVERDLAERARPMAERVEDAFRHMSTNPKIVLDEGRGIVWGRECWWTAMEDDDEVQRRFAKGRRIFLVPAPHPAETPA